MTQNIYDEEEFFTAYSRLERSVHGLDGAPEWPSLRALLPELRGRRVLDLGCGYGWFCRFARDHGASSILGVDVSSRMLERARELSSDTDSHSNSDTTGDTISYLRADLETVDLPTDAFDVAYSSLAFHYLTHLSALFERVHASLTPGGSLVFSIEHPIVTAAMDPGWIQSENGARRWPVDHFADEGSRTTNWLAPGVLKQHRTTGTYLNSLIRAGFTIAHVEDWMPTKEQVAARPEWAEERERPLFMLVAALSRRA
jgi:SAM-dependent methyltransferase